MKVDLSYVKTKLELKLVNYNPSLFINSKVLNILPNTQNFYIVNLNLKVFCQQIKNA